ncbi:MAG: arylsulfatase [Tannerella sp.]|jgi:arylsulfatase A-like enzyme|nr:arylsulfatase [Tannerella sp.]
MRTADFIYLSGILLPVFVGCKEKKTSPEESTPLNVIYILADDLGYGDIGCYGQSIIKTPHLDRMATEGMLFTQHYAGCTVSAPSRASLMTGFHTGHTQIRGNKEVNPEGQTPMKGDTYTLAKLFKSKNYATGIFGKWGLGYPGSESEPNAMGFDEFYGYNCQREAHSYYPGHLWHNREKVEFPENVDPGRQTYSHDLIHQQALQFIRNQKDAPFFAMLTYTLPHAELNLPHDSIYRMYENQFEEAPYDQSGSYFRSDKPRASFAAMVSQLDMYVGEIMDELRRQGLDKNTIIFFTSDNGPHQEGGADPAFFNSGGPLKGVKRDLYEGGIRVPLLVWSPGHVKAAVVSDHVSAFWDMMPTFAGMIGAELSQPTDGISFLPTLFGEGNQQTHDFLYWEFHEQGGRQAIRKDNWKLIRQGISAEGGTWLELYDLNTDKHEDTNLAEAEPGKVKELAGIMDNARTESELFNFGR